MTDPMASQAFGLAMNRQIRGVDGATSNRGAGQSQQSEGPSFGDRLGVEFSRHALQRMQQRGIELNGQDLEKIDQATEKAASRGSKDALVLLRDLGLVVNIKNRKVLTAVDAQSMQDKVFTNIDSTVIIRD
ncbi:MAG: TIGR02530 family flagellar biosynthesis protein [Planctomycetota bacterium]